VSIEDDYRDFYNFSAPRLCRGNKLVEVIKEVKEGVKSKDHMVSGFSSSKEACRKFAGSKEVFDERPLVDRLPAVLIFSEQEFHEMNPEAIKVVYEPEWLEQHPEVVEAIQTYPCLNRPLKDKVSSAECFRHEQETLVSADCAQIPEDAVVNVYVGPEEMEQANVVTPSMWDNRLGKFTSRMDEMVKRIKERLPEDFPFPVRVFFCHDTLNLNNICESACKHWDTIYPKRE
jgi:hypothetical protein